MSSDVKGTEASIRQEAPLREEARPVQDAPAAKPRGVEDVKPVNKAAAALGIVLFIAAQPMFMVPSIIASTTPIYPMLIACVGLGLILFAVGDEARILGTGFNLVGASAIALTIFYVWNDVSTSRDRKVRAYVTVGRASTAQALAVQGGSSALRPDRLVLVHKTGNVPGVMSHLADGRFLFTFDMTHEVAAAIEDADCPEIVVGFADGSRRSKSYKSESSNPLSSYGSKFDLIYQVDSNELSYRKDKAIRQMPDCDDRYKLAKQISAGETNTQTAPPITAPETKDVATSTPPASAAAGPARPPSGGPAPAGPAAKAQLVGYAVFSQIGPAQRANRPWFVVDGRPDARLPVPNETLTVIRDVRLRAVPYHWNDAQQKHVVPPEIAVLTPGRKVVVGGDAIIAYDETNGARYVIVPVASVADTVLPAVEAFRAESADGSIIGYAYAGSVDAESGDLSEIVFENLTKPDATYPTPNDILVAQKNVWLRAGPRRWDATRSEYVNEQTVTPIRKGQYVRVSGDTRLARGGLSIWVPIDRVSDALQAFAQAGK